VDEEPNAGCGVHGASLGDRTGSVAVGIDGVLKETLSAMREDGWSSTVIFLRQRDSGSGSITSPGDRPTQAVNFRLTGIRIRA